MAGHLNTLVEGLEQLQDVSASGLPVRFTSGTRWRKLLSWGRASGKEFASRIRHAFRFPRPVVRFRLGQRATIRITAVGEKIRAYILSRDKGAR